MRFIPFFILASALSGFNQSPQQAQRRENLPENLFSVVDTIGLSPEKREALDFLLSYMPLPDLVGHDAEFHIKNLDATFKAKEEMPWGKRIPEREFRHFVLPLRVNNEELDMSRPVFYEMLADRVKGLSMKDAILEVNHWCHEHVTYKPSDARTSPPLSSMSQAIGRCGEESTFTVAALRAVGIPARQVYTPRWAHTDDNHAWVEAWADGDWFFLGACEPAPVLDMAWFNAPASRGLMMTTNVFGKYDGPEEILQRDSLYTTINVTEKYAPLATLPVIVRNSDGSVVPDADVCFCIYNYNDFFPVTTKKTDSEGRASLTAGIGDFVIWASDGERFGFTTGRPGASEPVIVNLENNSKSAFTFELDIHPPKGSACLPDPPKEEIEKNDRRLKHEDALRKQYEDSFVSETEAEELASSLLPDSLKQSFVTYIVESRGNSRDLVELYKSLDFDKRIILTELLGSVTEKDRRDIPIVVLEDCIETYNILEPAAKTIGRDIFINYVLSPRIENEQLAPIRKMLLCDPKRNLKELIGNNPASISDWISKNIKVETESNPRYIRMTPKTVYNLGITDPKSRDIFFVALSRTLGIPSRIDPVTFRVQTYNDKNGLWDDVHFDDTTDISSKNKEYPDLKKGSLRLVYEQSGRLSNPMYYTHFSIASIKNGKPEQLEFDDGDGVNEINAKNKPLDAGQYMLLTGRRLADGGILSYGEIFEIKPGETTEVRLKLRTDPEKPQVIGSLNAENQYLPLGEETPRSILSETGRGYYVLGICKPNHEPSAHAINDISATCVEFDKWGGHILVLFEDREEAESFDRNKHGILPANLSFGTDLDGISLSELKESLNLETPELPVFVVADSFNRVVDVIQGYSIGLGERLLKTLSKTSE